MKRWKRSGLSAADLARCEELKAKQLHWRVWDVGTPNAAPLPDELRFLPVRW